MTLDALAYAVMAYGRTHSLVVRADVADETASRLRANGSNDVEVVPLYGATALAEAERMGMERAAKWHDEKAAECLATADEARRKSLVWTADSYSDDADTHSESAAAIRAEMEPRFPNVSCSQCGRDFGPGDNGFSHCRNHAGKVPK